MAHKLAVDLAQDRLTEVSAAEGAGVRTMSSGHVMTKTVKALNAQSFGNCKTVAQHVMQRLLLLRQSKSRRSRCGGMLQWLLLCRRDWLLLLLRQNLPAQNSLYGPCLVALSLRLPSAHGASQHQHCSLQHLQQRLLHKLHVEAHAVDFSCKACECLAGGTMLAAGWTEREDRRREEREQGDISPDDIS